MKSLSEGSGQGLYNQFKHINTYPKGACRVVSPLIWKSSSVQTQGEESPGFWILYVKLLNHWHLAGCYPAWPSCVSFGSHESMCERLITSWQAGPCIFKNVWANIWIKIIWINRLDLQNQSTFSPEKILKFNKVTLLMAWPISLLVAQLHTICCWDLGSMHVTSSMSLYNLQLPITPFSA